MAEKDKEILRVCFNTAYYVLKQFTNFFANRHFFSNSNRGRHSHSYPLITMIKRLCQKCAVDRSLFYRGVTSNSSHENWPARVWLFVLNLGKFSTILRDNRNWKWDNLAHINHVLFQTFVAARFMFPRGIIQVVGRPFLRGYPT